MLSNEKVNYAFYSMVVDLEKQWSFEVGYHCIYWRTLRTRLPLRFLEAPLCASTNFPNADRYAKWVDPRENSCIRIKSVSLSH